MYSLRPNSELGDMNAQNLKTILQRFGITLGVVGFALIILVVLMLAGYVPNLQDISHYVWLVLLGGYFIYLAIALHRRFSPSVVHQLLSVVTVCVAAIMVILIMQSGIGGRILRAAVAILCFFVVAVIYKLLLRWIGRVAFAKEIVE